MKYLLTLTILLLTTGCASIQVSSDIGLAGPVARATLPLLQSTKCADGTKQATVEAQSTARTIAPQMLREKHTFAVKCR